MDGEQISCCQEQGADGEGWWGDHERGAGERAQGDGVVLYLDCSSVCVDHHV